MLIKELNMQELDVQSTNCSKPSSQNGEAVSEKTIKQILKESSMDFDVVVGDFYKKVFCQKKYAIDKLIDDGTNASVYKVKQLDKSIDPKSNLAVKIILYSDQVQNEVDALLKLKKSHKEKIEEPNSHGKVAEIIDWGYIIQMD